MKTRQKISRKGIELIKSFEGLRQTAMRLPDGRWSLGYGHTFSAREGARVSEDDAEALLRFDLLPIVDAVNNLVQTPLSQDQFDALVSFCFNIGIEAFATSKVLTLVNEGRFDDAAQAMDAWRSAEFNGQVYVLEPLIQRRAAEKALFLGARSAPETVVPEAPVEAQPPKVEAPKPADTAEALLRFYSPYAASAKKPPLTVANSPAPATPDDISPEEAVPEEAAPTETPLEETPPEETAPEDIASQPEPETQTPPEPEPIQPEGGLSWRAHVTSPLPAEEQPVEAAPAEVQVPATNPGEAPADEAPQWQVNNGRVAISVEERPPALRPWQIIVRSILPWVITSCLGLACLGFAAGAFYKSRDHAIRYSTLVDDYMHWSLGMALVGIVCVTFSTWLIMRRLAGLK